MTLQSKEDVLKFDVAVDIRESLKALEKFSKTMEESMRSIAETNAQLGKTTEKTAKGAKEATDKWAKSQEKLNRQLEYHDELLEKRGNSLRQMRADFKRASGEEKERLRKDIAIQERSYKEQLAVARIAKTTRLKGGFGSRAFAPGLRKAIVNARDIGGDLENKRGTRNALKKAGEALKEPLETFLKKDASGLVEMAGKTFSTGAARGFHASRLLLRVGGIKSKRKGKQAIEAGKAAGGFKGALQQAGGTGSLVFGKLLSGLSSLIRPLATIGPILQTTLIGLVKLFIDLDAEVREFNKGIMESTSNLEFLREAGGRVEAASFDMTDALDGVRRAATDATFNNALGITKDTHTAILNTLTQEGVALGNLTTDAGNTAEGMKRVTQSIVQMGVAYSRGLGVPLQEISSFQAEMITEMGKGVNETRVAFAQVATAASRSGMAGVKFFNIIRSLSTDLALFNLRLEDSVGVLAKIGKVMSPQNAQKFMQNAVQGLKAMGRQDRLKLAMFAGDRKTKDIVDKDYTRREEALVKKLAGGDVKKEESIRARFREQGYKGVKGEIDALDPKQRSTIAQSAIQLRLQRSRMQKGEYGYAQALGHVGIGGAMEARRAGVLNKEINGKEYSSIAQAIGALGFEQVAEALSMSSDDLEDMATMEEAVEAQRETMKKEKGAAAAAAAGWDDLINDMSDEMKKAIGADADGRSMEEKMFALSREQGQKTQSFQEKLENFVEWVKTIFYDLMVDIYSALMKLPWLRGGFVAGKKEVLKSGNAELIKAFEDSVKDGAVNIGDVKDRMLGEGGGLGKRLVRLAATEEGRKQIAGSIQSNMTGKGVLAMARQSGLDPEKIVRLEQKLKRKRMGFNPMHGQMQEYEEFAGKGELSDILEVFKELGLTAEEQQRMLEKAGWAAADIAEFSGLVKDLGTQQGREARSTEQYGSPPPPGSAEAVAADAAVTTNEQLATVVEDNQKTQSILTQRGIKIAPATLKAEAKGMEAAMLAALRVALFEYYMYKDVDKNTMLKVMKEGGVGAGQVGKRFLEGAMAGESTLAGVNAVGTPMVLGKNAVGGLVTGVARGLAVVAAQGEGLASVAKGERIVPAGGGSTGVNVLVNGIGGQDLARLIEGKVVEGIREYRRREKFN